METAKVPEDLLNKYMNRAYEPEDGSESENDFNQRTEALKELSGFLQFLAESGQEYADKKGAPGLGKVTPKQFGELTTIFAERNISTKYLQKTPELAFMSMCTYIIGINLNWARAQKNKDELEVEKQDNETSGTTD